MNKKIATHDFARSENTPHRLGNQVLLAGQHRQGMKAAQTIDAWPPRKSFLLKGMRS
jgi:hypothetical protein